ncbi:spermatogenesis-associated protein 33 [Tenrec ecaudatus]|uniref:spermatogenesis-associated protein 33 n=1 Tax=Tenrec ecaudatus TaxID=94439 RepID=UPI003F5ACBAD
MRRSLLLQLRSARTSGLSFRFRFHGLVPPVAGVPSREAERKGTAYSNPKSKEKPLERASPEARQADRKSQDTPPRSSEAPYQRKVTPRRQGPSASLEIEEKPRPAKLSKTSSSIPQIVITSASNETLNSPEVEPKTIKEYATYGPLARHRNPSTVDAYHPEDLE